MWEACFLDYRTRLLQPFFTMAKARQTREERVCFVFFFFFLQTGSLVAQAGHKFTM